MPCALNIFAPRSPDRTGRVALALFLSLPENEARSMGVSGGVWQGEQAGRCSRLRRERRRRWSRRPLRVLCCTAGAVLAFVGAVGCGLAALFPVELG